jgi:hypothetical protein
MVLQLCGRVCRRLSFEDPHHLFDGDFLFYNTLCFLTAKGAKVFFLCVYCCLVKVAKLFEANFADLFAFFAVK